MKTSLFNTLYTCVSAVLLYKFLLGASLAFYGGSVNAELRLLGSVDNKSYFADDNSTMPWNEAYIYCLNNDMELATVKSKAQVEFLEKAADNLTYLDCYWTAGRDSMRPSQFAWGYTGEGENVKNCLIGNFIPNYPSSCLCYQPYLITSYRGVNCTAHNPILCETNRIVNSTTQESKSG